MLIFHSKQKNTKLLLKCWQRRICRCVFQKKTYFFLLHHVILQGFEKTLAKTSRDEDYSTIFWWMKCYISHFSLDGFILSDFWPYPISDGFCFRLFITKSCWMKREKKKMRKCNLIICPMFIQLFVSFS